MYKIYLDKNKTFECDITVEGANLNESEVRLYLESTDFNLSFKGKINSDGTVKIPINKLKGILQENSKGKIYLEVIAEDTRFIPWESEYVTDVSKKVEVKVDENSDSNKINESIKPKIVVNIREDIKPSINVSNYVNEILSILKTNNIRASLFKNNLSILEELILTYCQENIITEKTTIDSIRTDLKTALML